MTREITVLVTTTKHQTITSAAGNQGNAGESRARQANPPAAAGTSNVGVKMLGTPIIAVYNTVRRGDEGMSAARTRIISAEPKMPRIDRYASAIKIASEVVSERSRTKPTST